MFPLGRKRGRFLGRKTELERLQSFLSDEKDENGMPRRKIIIVQGGIGTGKTQLCLDFAWRNQSR